MLKTRKTLAVITSLALMFAGLSQPGNVVSVKAESTEGASRTGAIATADLTDSYSVSITNPKGSHIILSEEDGNGAEQQKISATAASYKSVTYQVEEGYYVAEGYSVAGAGNGIGVTVTRNAQGSQSIMVSGIPTGNVNITLMGATLIDVGTKPTDTATPGGLTAGDGEILGTNNYYGSTKQMEYRLQGESDADWKDCTDGSTTVEPGTYEVRYKEDDTYSYTKTTSITVVKAKFTVNNPEGSHITKSTAVGNGEDVQGVALGNSITSVIYTADDGYFFPEDYKPVINGTEAVTAKGITVSRESVSQITISGNIEGNVSITLKPASQIVTPQAPDTLGEADGKITGTTSGMEYRPQGGSDTEWRDCTDGSTAVEPGTYEVRVKETDTNYAGDVKIVTVNQRYAVTINNPTDSHITCSAGDGQQKVTVGDAMTAVTYQADSGYYFPDTYNVAGQNGVTVTRDSESQITVSGTPTADVAITLTAATMKPAATPAPAATPTVTLKPAATPTVTPKPVPTVTPAPAKTVTSAEKKANSLQLDIGMFARWSGNKYMVTWGKVADADEYDILASQCGKKMSAESVVKTVKAGKTSTVLEKIRGKKLSSEKTYKVKVKAYKYIDGKRVYIGGSKIYHVAGKDSKKYTDVKEIKVDKESVTLKKSDTSRIKSTVAKKVKKKKLLPEWHGDSLRYYSTDTDIATVTKKGKIEAKKKGTCDIYVTSLNGVKAKVKVTVK